MILCPSSQNLAEGFGLGVGHHLDSGESPWFNKIGEILVRFASVEGSETLRPQGY